MCAIVDNCAFSQVFDQTNKNHGKFKPVRDWIVDGAGKIVYGGSKYARELKQGRRAKFLAELSRRGKTVQMPTDKVDQTAGRLKKKVPEDAFDDEHIVALVIVSKCRIVCTGDGRSLPYLKRRDLYPTGVKRPKVYSSARNADLCCPRNVIDICR